MLTIQDFHIEIVMPNAIAPRLTEQDVRDALSAKLLEKLDMTREEAKASIYADTTITVSS